MNFLKSLLFFVLSAVLVNLAYSDELSKNVRKITPTYQVTFVDFRWPDRPFVVKVDPKNKDGIESLERYLKAGLQVELGEEDSYVNIGLPNGKVRKVKASKDHAWNFEIDPTTVGFTDAAIEVCDATFMYIEKDIDKWIEEVGQYCPWGAGKMFVSVQRSWVR